MATVETHYKKLLSNIYAWMLGGFDFQIPKNQEFFKSLRINPERSKVAIDLGAGCGFQSIPLAKIGFSVTAIDLDFNLLQELAANDTTGTVTIIEDDLINFIQHVKSPSELIVCMTDTVLHLESKDMVRNLFNKVFEHLENLGKFVITFRDLSQEIEELDRFFPVKQDENTIFSCFLEYEKNSIKVHDLLYTKESGQWVLCKSFYHKLRLSPSWVESQLTHTGFGQVAIEVKDGLVTVIATKTAE